MPPVTIVRTHPGNSNDHRVDVEVLGVSSRDSEEKSVFRALVQPACLLHMNGLLL